MHTKIIKNAVRCHKCNDIIESTHVHDFKWCSCGNVAVDGGHDYLKRAYKEADTWDDLSETIKLTDEEYEAELEERRKIFESRYKAECRDVDLAVIEALKEMRKNKRINKDDYI